MKSIILQLKKVTNKLIFLFILFDKKMKYLSNGSEVKWYQHGFFN